MHKRPTKAAFRKRVYRYYRSHGRTLPWRAAVSPYRILVSEVMLQQTQVGRVVPYYRGFLKRFPTLRALARAPLADVLAAWSGLGYNRRGKALHELARIVVAERGGRIPRNEEELRKLPSIGPYTAAAIRVFAFHEPAVLVETNIKTAILYEWFAGARGVPDTDVARIVEQTCDAANPREWYFALMDYGAHIKRTRGNQNARGAHHYKQKPFAGSSRQLRGAIIRELTKASRGLTTHTLARFVGRTNDELTPQLARLANEGLVEKHRSAWRVPR